MSRTFIKKSAKYANMIITAGITGLIFFSLVPLIFETIEPEEDHYLSVATPYYIKNAVIDPENATLTLYQNHLMMEDSFNEDVVKLAEVSGPIFIYLWLTIIFGFVALIGVMLHSSQKFQGLSKIILIMGCLCIVSSSLLLFQLYTFISATGSTENVHLAALLHMDFPINYIQLIFLISIFAFLGSILYVRKAISILVKRKKDNKSEIVQDKKQSKFDEKKNIAEDKQLDSFANHLKEAKDKDLKYTIKTPIALKQKTLEKHTSENEVNTRDDEYVPELTDIHSQVNITNNEKKYRVKCPQCRNNFIIIKKDSIVKIKCPHCGKEGILK